MSEQTTKYEIMAIIDNSLDEKAAEKQAQDSLVKRIKALKGEVTFEDFWGARGFAYIIKKQTWGYYVVLQFTLSPAALQELKKELNIDKHIVRFLVTKVDKKAPVPRKYADVKKEWEALEKERKIAEIDQKPKRKISTASKPSVEKNDEEVKSSEKKSTKKVATPKKDDLDKKLDKILEDSSIDL